LGINGAKHNIKICYLPFSTLLLICFNQTSNRVWTTPIVIFLRNKTFWTRCKVLFRKLTSTCGSPSYNGDIDPRHINTMHWATYQTNRFYEIWNIEVNSRGSVAIKSIRTCLSTQLINTNMMILNKKNNGTSHFKLMSNDLLIVCLYFLPLNMTSLDSLRIAMSLSIAWCRGIIWSEWKQPLCTPLSLRQWASPRFSLYNSPRCTVILQIKLK